MSNQKEHKLSIIHFNDAYHIGEGHHEPVGGASRFRSLIKSLDHLKPLVLFGGDMFNPSLLSSITKGTHMCDVLNLLSVRNAVVGNHDFDFGIDHLTMLLSQTRTRWILSNLTQRSQSSQKGVRLCNTLEYDVFEWNKIRIGVIGLIEKDWLDTLTFDISDLIYEDFAECGRRLSRYLKQEQGTQVVIALTHMRFPNDEKLAASVPGIDLILGGHDHHYEWKKVNGTIIAKNSADFHYLTLVNMTFSPQINGTEDSLKSVNSYEQKNWLVELEHLEVNSNILPDLEMQQLVEKWESILHQKMEKVIAYSSSQLDARSSVCRTQESAIGSFVCDILQSELCSDVCILNSGTIRSDLVYGPGPITLGQLLQIFPFEDLCSVILVTGAQLLAGLENAVSQYPKHEGRFPQVSGIKFSFDAKKESGRRISKVYIKDSSSQFKELEMDAQYKLATKSYLTEGKDGFDCWHGVPFVTQHESGHLLSSLIREHLSKLKTEHTNVDGALVPVINPHVEGRITIENQQT